MVVTRVSLSDGHSDSVLGLLAEHGLLPATKVVVLAAADFSPKQEARQLSLGADCVLRDPLRTEVLVEYVAKFLRTPIAVAARGIDPRSFPLARATVRLHQQQIQCGAKVVHISPKECELARLLAESAGKVLTYDLLYSELFGRVFSGDSANLRVLLGKLASSYRKLGIDLRAMIRVTPKSGYTYTGEVIRSGTQPRKIKKPRPKSRL